MNKYVEILNQILFGSYIKEIEIPILGKANLIIKTNGPVDIRCIKQKNGFDILFIGNKPKIIIDGKFIFDFPGTLEKFMIRDNIIEIDIKGLPNIKREINALICS